MKTVIILAAVGAISNYTFEGLMENWCGMYASSRNDILSEGAVHYAAISASEWKRSSLMNTRFIPQTCYRSICHLLQVVETKHYLLKKSRAVYILCVNSVESVSSGTMNFTHIWEKGMRNASYVNVTKLCTSSKLPLFISDALLISTSFLDYNDLVPLHSWQLAACC